MSTPQDSSNVEPKEVSSFERWRQRAAWVTGLGLSPEDQKKREEFNLLKGMESDWKRCEKWKTEMLHNSPAVVFMMKQLQLIDCNVTAEHLQCHPCHKVSAGGFSPQHGILLCQDGFFNKKHMEDTVVHELIHMYDHAKFKADMTNIKHQACSEIRAANLSGDCSYRRNVHRGHWYKFTGHQRACVRMRAVASLVQNPACPSQAAAEKAVDEVWDSCIKDTRPFDEIY
ncbi:Mitochondrial inner membrane protease atp23 [Serendipita sp. 405]|nr:Mitochondrial inner membrane protease atp23 [Serendipita sp. 405]